MSTPLRTLAGLSTEGRRVFLRADLNVPLRDGRVTDDTRIRASLESLEHLRHQGARVVLASHLGRPKGARVQSLSLRPVAERLGIPLAADCIGHEVERQVSELANGDALLLENLRFHKGEEANAPDFVQALARLCDAYVNDAFGTAHRAHASTVGVPRVVPDRAAGFLMEREIEALERVAEHPDLPYVCILGGAKVSDKLAVLETLSQRADCLVIGGAMAYTFMAAKGLPIGRSRVEQDLIPAARALLEGDAEILLPIDHVVAASPERIETIQTVDEIPADQMALDIGPRSVEAFAARIAGAATIFWNGPLGLFENPAFEAGTRGIAEAVARSSAYSVVGGGDSLAAVHSAGVADRISHLSTGGGASLEFVEGRSLPGVEILRSDR